MAEITKIQWTDATVNFWTGCKKVSQGCKFCYMYRDQERYGRDPSDVLRVKETTINRTLKQLEARRQHEPGPLKIFTCSWSDFFIEEADAWRSWAWEIIRAHPQHIWQILTKRPERILKNLPDDWGEGWPNVWLGATIEDGENMHRLYNLDDIPAKIKFVSFEPLLGPIYPTGAELEVLTRVNWAIIGGESGNENGAYKYRPAQLDWFLNLTEALQSAGVNVFIKQLGTHLAKKHGLKDKRAGGDVTEFPKRLQIREFPRILAPR